MRYTLDLTETEYNVCVNALCEARREADNEYTDVIEDIFYKLDTCEYLDTKRKIALLKEVIDCLQDDGEEG